MKRILLATSFLTYCMTLVSQHSFIIPKGGEITPSEVRVDYYPRLMNLEMPKPGGIGKSSTLRENISVPQPGDSTPQYENMSDAALGMNFMGNPFGNSTPNDNDMAISNGGKIISVINSTIFFYDVPTDTTQGVLSLAAFSAPLGMPHQEFDPKVSYDPIEDRFVLVCLNGFTDSTSDIIVGFSQTNDPTGTWNLYSLPGDPLNNNLWTDYPIIALTQGELFITANLLYNDSTWQAGFVESIVWQIKKQDGYSGIALTTNLINNIGWNSRPIRNLCPVKGGSTLYGPELFMMSNRNFETQGDTFFLVKIADTIGGANFAVTVKQLNSSADYFMAGDARQLAPHMFATNDSRTLGAFIENNKIQFVHNCKDTATGYTALYHGVLTNPNAVTPTIVGQVIADTTLDLGYPNISYAGNSSTDNTAIITFDHSSPTVYAGCSAIKTDGNGSYSNILRIKNGSSYVNLLTALTERWGDYSGSQRKYNNPGEVWMSGYFGYFGSFTRKHGAWIGQVYKDQTMSGLNEEESFSFVNVFPNPAPEFVEVEFTLDKRRNLTMELMDVSGKSVLLLMRERAKAGLNKFTFSIANLQPGVYFLNIHENGGVVATKKIVKL